LFAIAIKKLKIQPAQFWVLTPYELRLRLEGVAQEKAERQQELLYLAWHIEAFARQKRLPSFKKLIKDSGKTKKTQSRLSTEQLMTIAQSKGLKVPMKWRGTDGGFT
jgi:ATP-dependent exoDNAse (exonuclease V) beta subunit